MSRGPEDKEQRIRDEADHLFGQKEYSKSAILYASSTVSFEEVALKFVEAGDRNALKDFLICKLDTLSEKDVTQITLVMMWLLEILLDLMAQLRNSSRMESEEYQLLNAEFRSLLNERKIKGCLVQNRQKILELIASHGDVENILSFAQEIKDYPALLDFLIQRKRFDRALEILREKGSNEMIYRFSPTLMSAAPRKVINLLMERGRRLDPSKIVPTLLQDSGDQKMKQEVIRYLENCILKQKVEDPVLNNYLLALYTECDPPKLEEYLEMTPRDDEGLNYDPKYLLRICREKGLDAACVRLYARMSLYEESVDLALTSDVQLAKRIADMPEDNDDLRKKLWLRIVRHVIRKETVSDVRRVTDFIKECELLEVADILPFFPDFETIEVFKEAICTSLQEYNDTIESLKGEMREASENLEELKDELKGLRTRHSIIRTCHSCDICSEPVMLRPFHVFPCNHLFHSECLLNHLMAHHQFSSRDKQRVQEIQRQLLLNNASTFGQRQAVTASHHLDSSSLGVSGSSDHLLRQMDQTISSVECIFCGEFMISTVDEPFLSGQESSLMASWE